MTYTKIKYNYVILSEYQPLNDGSPNFHHTPAVRFSDREHIVIWNLKTAV